ncbi:unnamed protein product [Cunninghamella blakesleeana]
MDPGSKLLAHIKTVPNLISEDPSIVTPKNTSFMDLPWSELSKLMKKQERRSSTDTTSTDDSSSDDDSSVDNALWDANTYQASMH